MISRLRQYAIISLLLLTGTPTDAQPDFLSEQKKYERVKIAWKEKETPIMILLESMKIQLNEFHLLIVAYKAEQELILYGKNKRDTAFQFLAAYPICALSGELGPKRRQGDNQVPEGLYHITQFNPVSNFYLSLVINYPNRSDRKKSTAKNLGGNICIHGSCVTIGCLPMTDEKIKEIYLYAMHARQNGQEKIPVYIFPFKMSDTAISQYKRRFAAHRTLLNFWENLKSGYDLFTANGRELIFTTDSAGKYVFLNK